MANSYEVLLPKKVTPKKVLQTLERAVSRLSGRVAITTPDFWSLDPGYSHLWVVTLPDSPEEGNPEGHRFAVQFSKDRRVIYFRSGGGYFDLWLQAFIRERMAKSLNGKLTHDSTDKYRTPLPILYDREGGPFKIGLRNNFLGSLIEFFGIYDPDEINRIAQSSPKGFQ
jgi:hypothetical protein